MRGFATEPIVNPAHFAWAAGVKVPSPRAMTPGHRRGERILTLRADCSTIGAE